MVSEEAGKGYFYGCYWNKNYVIMKETCNQFYRGMHMITGEIKNKVDKIWENVWAAGLTNPLSVIEQITYLMFIRALDDQEINNIRSKTLLGADVELIFPESDIGQAMRWSNFKFRNADEIYNIVSNFVFPAIKAMKHGKLPDFDEHGKLIPIPDTDETKDGFDFFAKHMSTATFIVPTAQVLEKIITGLDDLYTHDIANLDMQGDLYEYMLSKLSTAGTNGQFRTPKHIREMMVKLLKPSPQDIICDPACGTAGFLVSAAEYVRANHSEKMDKADWKHYESNMFSGFDTDTTMLRISAMNLMLHSIKYPQVDYKDSLSKQNTIHDAYTICLANPPFKGSLDKETINDELRSITNNTKKTELLFLALFLRILKKGGTCACIVPDGVLFGSSKAHVALRKEIIENHHLRAIISMPSGVFKPYAGVSTAIMIFTKTQAGGTNNVWFYDMKADGFSLDDKRQPIEDNDITDIIERFEHIDRESERKRTEQSFLVSKQEIVDNGYDLSINKYKEIEYIPVEYPPTSEILANIKALNEQIMADTIELERLLNE